MVYRKIAKGIPPLNRLKIGKKITIEGGWNKNYMKLIGDGMIVNSNYTGTSLNGLTQVVKSKGNNSFQLFQTTIT